MEPTAPTGDAGAAALGRRHHLPERCVQCDAPLQSPIGCLNCHALFPAPSALSHFDRLGLPVGYPLDRTLLEARFLGWSREFHPDYHQLSSPEDQRLSLQLSAALNDAYATLRDPVKRAEYLLSLHGGPTASQQREMPAAFLEEVLERRMEIEEAKADGATAAVAAIEEGLSADRDRLLADLADLFRTVETGDSAAKPAALLEIRRRLNACKYIDGLLADLRD
ncbi:MAG: Fe-S protein assembly co-chaperone HscB, partial [Planctomycetia bacterium]